MRTLCLIVYLYPLYPLYMGFPFCLAINSYLYGTSIVRTVKEKKQESNDQNWLELLKNSKPKMSIMHNQFIFFEIWPFY